VRSWSYVTGNNSDSPGLFSGGNNLVLGTLTDAVYLNGTGFQLTTAWTAGASLTHWWTTTFSTTVFGSATGVSYNDTVKTGRWFCGGSGAAPQGLPSRGPRIAILAINSSLSARTPTGIQCRVCA
jgi:hypothetical protein